TLATAAVDHSGAGGAAASVIGIGPSYALLIPGLALLAFVLTALCAALRVKSKLPAVITVVCLAGSFAATLYLYLDQFRGHEGGTSIVAACDWIRFNWNTTGQGSATTTHEFVANFGLYLDSLTVLWMLFVTGL